MAKSMMIEGKSDEEWRAQHDYDMLCRAAEVIGDKKRYDAAMKAGEKKLEEMSDLKKMADGLRKRD